MVKTGVSTETHKEITQFCSIDLRNGIVTNEGFLPLRVKLANFNKDKKIKSETLHELLTNTWFLEYATYNPLQTIEECVCGIVSDLKFNPITGVLDGLVTPYGKRRKILLELLKEDMFLSVVLKAIYRPASPGKAPVYTKVISFVLRNTTRAWR